MKQKKLISLVTAMLLLITALSGCGQDEKVQDNSQSTSQKVEGSESVNQPEEEPTVITFASTTKFASDPVLWCDTEVMEYVEKLANVKIEYVEYDAELFNLALTSGELPDIVLSTVSNKIDDVVQSGLALDMEPYLEEYAPNVLLDVYAQRNDLVKTLKGGKNNGLYFIAPRIGVEAANGGTEVGRGYVVRWDYYQEIGAPEIKNDADFIDAIEKMVAAHPTTESGEKVYGMGLREAMTYWYERGMSTETVAANLWTFTGHQYLASYHDGRLMNGYTDIENSAYWADMKFYNELHKRGLLDPDSFSQTTQELQAKIKAGRYVAAVRQEAAMYTEMRKADPETLAGFVAVPSENTVIHANSKALLGYFPSNYMFISAKSENKEAALRFINVLHDPEVQRIFWAGFEGEHWNYVNGVPTFTDKMLNLMAEAGDSLAKLGARKVPAVLYMTEPTFLHTDGYPMDPNQMEENIIKTLNPLQQSFAQHYGVQIPSQAQMALVEKGECIDLSEFYGSLVVSGVPAMPTDVARILEKCNDILYKAIPKLVMAQTEDEFKAVQTQVMADLKAVDEQEAWEWCLEAYNAACKEIVPIFEAVDW